MENLEAPEGNITGTSDAIPVEKIFELAAELTPDAESFGLIYNTGEDVYKRQGYTHRLQERGGIDPVHGSLTFQLVQHLSLIHI